MAQLRQINNEEILSVRKCQVHRYRCDEIQAGSSLPKIGNKVVTTYTGLTLLCPGQERDWQLTDKTGMIRNERKSCSMAMADDMSSKY